MKRIIYLAIHRRGLMFVLFLFLAIVGYYSWARLAIDAYPDIADTTVQVVTQVPGLAAEEIEQQISIPIERAMNGLPGLNVMRSRIRLVYLRSYWFLMMVLRIIGPGNVYKSGW